MSETKSTPTPVTYTSEEQVNLRNLEVNGRVLANVSQLLKNGLFPGGTAQTVLESIMFIESIIQNNSQQANAIYAAAQKRSQAATSEEATASTKKTAKAN